jgi:hypothetical protein
MVATWRKILRGRTESVYLRSPKRFGKSALSAMKQDVKFASVPLKTLNGKETLPMGVVGTVSVQKHQIRKVGMAFGGKDERRNDQTTTRRAMARR